VADNSDRRGKLGPGFPWQERDRAAEIGEEMGRMKYALPPETGSSGVGERSLGKLR